MKRIEKLTEEALSQDHTNAQSSESHMITNRLEGSFRQGFEAGFRKALELAAAHVDDGMPYNERLAEELRAVGEKEV